jgi:hypothetical protein
MTDHSHFTFIKKEFTWNLQDSLTEHRKLSHLVQQEEQVNCRWNSNYHFPWIIEPNWIWIRQAYYNIHSVNFVLQLSDYSPVPAASLNETSWIISRYMWRDCHFLTVINRLAIKPDQLLYPFTSCRNVCLMEMWLLLWVDVHTFLVNRTEMARKQVTLKDYFNVFSEKKKTQKQTLTFYRPHNF